LRAVVETGAKRGARCFGISRFGKGDYAPAARAFERLDAGSGPHRGANGICVQSEFGTDHEMRVTELLVPHRRYAVQLNEREFASVSSH